MSSDYQEAIKVLTKRKTILEEELHSINMAIAVLAAQNAALDFSIIEHKSNNPTIKIPPAYNSNLKYPAKVLWLLENTGPQTVVDMIDTLSLIDNVSDAQKLFNGLTYAASGLYKKGELSVEKVGKAYKYSIKKKGDQLTA